MKRLMTIALATCAAIACATDYTWTGAAGDGKWNTAGNWTGGVPQPGASNRAIFDPGDGVAITVSGYSYNFYMPRTVVVKSGTVSFSANAYANDQGGSSSLPLVFDISSGATVNAAFRLERASFMNVQKTGGGSLSLSNVCGYDRSFPPLGTFEVAAGRVTVSDSIVCTSLVVRSGAQFAGAYRLSAKTYNGVSYPKRCLIEEGGTVTSPGETTLNLGYLEGAGTFDFVSAAGNLSVTLPQASSSCTFGGTLGANVKFSVPETAVGTFVLGSTDTMAGNSSNDIDPAHFAFAPGVGTFRIAAAKTLGEGRLCLEDADGLPVMLHSTPGGTFRTSGAGSYMLSGSSATFKGDSLSNTGIVGALSGATLQLGGGAAYPSLDFDFGHLSEVRAEGTVLLYSSVADIPLLSCGASSVVEAYGQTSVRRMEGVRQFKVYGDVSVDGGRSDRFYQLTMGSGAQLTVNGGEFFNGIRQNAQDSTSTLGYCGGTHLGGSSGTLVLNGGRLYLRRDSSVVNPHLRLKGGVFTAHESYYSNRDPSNPTTVLLDGGEWALSAVPDSHYSYGMFADSDAISVSVGENGARLRTCNVTQRDDSKFYVNRPISNGTGGVDGGVEFYGRGTLYPNYPWTIAGPVRLLDGIVTFAASADIASTPSWFGTGDVVLGTTVLDLSPITSGECLHLASGAGSRVELRGAAAIRLAGSSSGTAEHVMIGPEGAASGAAMGVAQGGLLMLRDAGSAMLDGSQSSVKVNGGVPNCASGLSSLPVFLARGSTVSEMYFTSYDPDGGFVRFTDEKTSFGTASDVVFCASGEMLDVPGNATACAAGIRIGTYGGLRFGSQARLALGDGVHPAGIIMSRRSWIGSGGTIDFGTGPGVVVVGDYEADGTSGTISSVIAGSAGVTFASYPLYGYRRIGLSADNTYSGGTHIYAVRVSAGSPGCFGTGLVEIGAGERIGGKVCFGTAGTWTNDFKVSGWGMAENTYGAESHGYGAMAFDANVVLSGAVELSREARVCAWSDGVTAELSGTVSGDRLVCWRGSGRLVLSGSNVYTGGTRIVKSTVVARRGTSLGTAPVELDAGVLRFENQSQAVFANDLSGNGAVALAGGAPVSFAGDVSAFAGPLDLCGTRQVFTELPPFSSVTNSSDRVATISLSRNLGTVAWNGMSLDSEFKLEIGEGTILDLGGAEINVRCVAIGSSGRIVNGVVTESRPQRAFQLTIR